MCDKPLEAYSANSFQARSEGVNAFFPFPRESEQFVMDERVILRLPLKWDCPETKSMRRFDPYTFAVVLMRNKETAGVHGMTAGVMKTKYFRQRRQRSKSSFAEKNDS